MNVDTKAISVRNLLYKRRIHTCHRKTIIFDIPGGMILRSTLWYQTPVMVQVDEKNKFFWLHRRERSYVSHLSLLNFFMAYSSLSW